MLLGGGLSRGVSGQRPPLCVVTEVAEGLLWEPVEAWGGYQTAKKQKKNKSIWHNSWRSQEISMQEIMQYKQGSYDYFITFIYLGLSSICRKWLECDNSPTKQPIFTTCLILQTFFLILEAFPGWIFCLLHPSSAIFLCDQKHKGGGYKTQVEAYESVHRKAFSASTHFPLR